MEHTVGDVTVELVQGNIVRQDDLDAVVNAANAKLMPGGGVAGAIHRAAGSDLKDACRPLAPIDPGQAVITDGFDLPNAHVIHVLGPRYGEDEPADELLADCYRNALTLAEESDLGSVGFPSISTGAFGYPTEEAAEVALSTVIERAPTLTSVQRIRFVLFDEEALDVHEAALERITGDPG